MLYTTSVDDVTPCVRDTIEQKILTCLLGKKEQKTSRGNTGPKAQCCICDLENPFYNFSKFVPSLLFISTLNFRFKEESHCA